MDECIASRKGKASSLLAALIIVVALCLCLGSHAAFAASGAAASKSSDAAATTLTPLSGDTAGTVFSQESTLFGSYTSGDLYWANQNLAADNVKVGNDLMAVASTLQLSNVEVDGDARLGARAVTLSSVNVRGNGTFACDSLDIGSGTKAKGLYCASNAISYAGTAKYLVAYGNKIYFNGTVNGDVVLSAQEIEIGPNAKVAGTLQVRSGQDLNMPDTASIANVNNALDNPNAIDQISEIRSLIAPYFQVGSTLFVVVSFILLALLLLWFCGRQLDESMRVAREHPFGQFLLGVLGTVIITAAAAVCFALVFTIPVGIALLLVLVIALLLCIPFTGAAVALQLNAFPRAVRVMIGAGIAAALMFVTYVRAVVLAVCLISFVGYALRVLLMGHDDEFNRQMRRAHGKPQPAHADADGQARQESRQTAVLESSAKGQGKQVAVDEGAPEGASKAGSVRERENDVSQSADSDPKR